MREPTSAARTSTCQARLHGRDHVPSVHRGVQVQSRLARTADSQQVCVAERTPTTCCTIESCVFYIYLTQAVGHQVFGKCYRCEFAARTRCVVFPQLPSCSCFTTPHFLLCSRLAFAMLLFCGAMVLGSYSIRHKRLLIAAICLFPHLPIFATQQEDDRLPESVAARTRRERGLRCALLRFVSCLVHLLPVFSWMLPDQALLPGCVRLVSWPLLPV